MLMDSDEYKKVEMSIPLLTRSYTQVPASYSLKKFTPTPQNQGAMGTCVGWSSAYAARTILEAIANGFSSGQIDQNTFSPSYVYNQIRQQGDYQCQQGTWVHEALDVMTQQGVSKLSDFGYECSKTVTSRDKQLAAPYKIDGYKRLFDEHDRNKEVPVKKALSENKPVVIGMLCPPSFYDAKGVWKPNRGEEYGNYGGHAMCVIGYDDNKYGGAFEIMNSWGTGWGNQGYIWVTYEDFNKFFWYGFDVIPAETGNVDYNDVVDNEEEEEDTYEDVNVYTDMQGELTFNHIDGKTMDANVSGDVFRMNSSYPSGTRFNVEITTDKPAYVYVIATDKTNKYNRIFPRDPNYSSHLGSNSTVVMPGPTENYFTKMDNTIGTDYYILLYSKKQLDLDDIVNKMNYGSGDIQTRLRSVFGRKLVDQNDVTLSDNGGIKFAANSKRRMVLPVIVELEHVAGKQEYVSDNTPPVIVITSPQIDNFRGLVNEDEEAITIDEKQVNIVGQAQDESDIKTVTVGGKSVPFTKSGKFSTSLSFANSGKNEFKVYAEDINGNKKTTTFTVFIR